MSEQPPDPNTELVNKIACLTRERGWNQEDFARNTGLNRQTARMILLPGGGDRRLRNNTIKAIADAFGLTVNELYTLPLEMLLPRMHRKQGPPENDGTVRYLYEQATQPELLAWIERNPERARKLNSAMIDELLSMQGTGGPLTQFGVEQAVAQVERKYRIIGQVHDIAGTEYLDLLEQFVGLLHEKVQPYRDRA
jgi:DNA-binding XRE family transcriptional regulator